MSDELLKKAAARSMKENVPKLRIGDTVRVHVRIIEGEKQRIQTFQGTVIGRKGKGISETFTVRRIVSGQGVERVFPIHSPKVAGVDVVRSGKVRRAKLYYLRDRVGKKTRLKEVRRPGKKQLVGESASELLSGETDAEAAEPESEAPSSAESES